MKSAQKEGGFHFQAAKVRGEGVKFRMKIGKMNNNDLRGFKIP
jgi:hypothetical protein